MSNLNGLKCVWFANHHSFVSRYKNMLSIAIEKGITAMKSMTVRLRHSKLKNADIILTKTNMWNTQNAILTIQYVLESGANRLVHKN
ncbi:MAG: hypothetical protein ACI8SE_000249 [Bacteroidia bacterium]|jgi:hypothetical protein